MVHVVGFRDGKAFYRNRFVKTDGLLAETDAGGPLWAGLAEPVRVARREDGWGARGQMKDASSTDVIVHRGVALTSFYQCGDLYRLDPSTAETLGKESWNGRFPSAWGVSAHPKVDGRTGELLFFNYSKQAPYMGYGVVDEHNDLVHQIDVPLPGPRLPHDMAFTENYAILNDFPLFWDPELLERNAHVARFHRDMPSRLAVIPRRGQTSDIQWFEAESTFVLHFTNAYEDGDEIVLDGFFQGDPEPTDNGLGDRWQRAFRFLALDRMQTRLHRWRLNLVTGGVREEQLSDSITEFGMINAGYAGTKYRYTYAATGKPGWFLFDGLVKHDLATGAEERFSFPDGVYGSETAMAPRVGSTGEDDGYLITLTTDINADASHCLVFDAARVADGPLCTLALPERISSGTHSTWAAGSELRRWDTAQAPASAIGL
jgi:carotenoid cleavage dioxygenase